MNTVDAQCYHEEPEVLLTSSRFTKSSACCTQRAWVLVLPLASHFTSPPNDTIVASSFALLSSSPSFPALSSLHCPLCFPLLSFFTLAFLVNARHMPWESIPFYFCLVCLYMVVYPESQLSFLMEDCGYNLQGVVLTILLKLITTSISSYVST